MVRVALARKPPASRVYHCRTREHADQRSTHELFLDGLMLCILIRHSFKDAG